MPSARSSRRARPRRNPSAGRLLLLVLAGLALAGTVWVVRRFGQVGITQTARDVVAALPGPVAQMTKQAADSALDAVNPGRYFTWRELTTTSRPLPNEPDALDRARIIYLARYLLDPIREALGPVRVTSAYRSEAVNTAVGGAKNSYHRRGLAADLYVNGLTHENVVTWLWLNKEKLPIAEAIVERHTGHTHVAVAKPGEKTKINYFADYDGKKYRPWTPSAEHVAALNEALQRTGRIA